MIVYRLRQKITTTGSWVTDRLDDLRITKELIDWIVEVCGFTLTREFMGTKLVLEERVRVG